MMDLKQRLARLDKLSRSRQPTEASGDRDFDAQARLTRLGLDRRTNAAGEFWAREEGRRRPEPPGPFPSLAGFFSRARPPWPDPRHILFLDVESTGLAGGTGTLPFLVGVAWWQEGTFRDRQYFMAGPQQEAAVLKDLTRLAGKFRVVVTYNGSSFDLPLLRTRYVLNRQRSVLDGLQNWDLLIPARRLWDLRLW